MPKKRNNRLGRSKGINRMATTTKQCECPNCGNIQSEKRAKPCTEVKCEKCGSMMRGEYCK